MRYNSQFFEDQVSDSQQSARVVAPFVTGLVKPRSVVDVGCGVGAWLYEFGKLGIQSTGLDGQYVPRDQLLIGDGAFVTCDLSKPIRLGRTFDLAVCLEVAEHLPAERGPGLVADLVEMAPVVLYSAAIPGQGGLGHVNERWQSYWEEIFVSYGYSKLDVLRAKFWNNPRVNYYYSQNMMLYCARAALDKSPELQCALAESNGMPTDVGHPNFLSGRPRLRDIAHVLPRLLRHDIPRAVRNRFRYR